MAGFLAGFFVREIGDDSDGDVSTSVSVLSLVVTIAFVLVGGLVEYLTSKRVR